MNRHIPRTLWLWLTLVIVASGVVYGIIYSARPYMLDDVSYYISNRSWLLSHRRAWLQWPTHIIGMWLEVNGRLGDATNILWLNVLPDWARGVAEGVFLAGLYSGAVLWIRRLGYNVGACVIATALLMFVLPWWDAFGLYVLHINYLWASTMVIFALYFLFWRLPRSIAGKTVLCIAMFVAAAWHEAVGVPMAIAFGLAMAVKGINPAMRWPMVWGILGGLYSVSSPGILARMAVGHTPDDPIIPLILKTVPFAAILTVAIIAKLVRSPRALRQQFTADNCRTGILTALSLASAAVAVGSGFVGRSGWFAQVFSLLAMASLWAGTLTLIPDSGRWVQAGVSAVLLALMSVQIILTGIYQTRFDKESKVLISRYLESEDGIVVSDLPDYRGAPDILLNRAHAFPPQYDPWLQESLKIQRADISSRPNGTGSGSIDAQPPLTIIPPALAAVMDSLDSVPAVPVEVDGGVVLSRESGAIAFPEGTYPHRIEYNGLSAIVYVPIPPGSRPWND